MSALSSTTSTRAPARGGAAVPGAPAAGLRQRGRGLLRGPRGAGLGAGERQLDGERRALAGPAADADRAALQPHELAHERETDARALVAAGFRAADAVEALEHPRQVGLGDA